MIYHDLTVSIHENTMRVFRECDNFKHFEIYVIEKMKKIPCHEKKINILELLMIVIDKHYNISLSINSQKYAVSKLSTYFTLRSNYCYDPHKAL